jgi:ribosomal protein S18 acetylase RimI-like enzyme
MTERIAEQIAELLNTRNKLVVKYTTKKVLDFQSNYVFIEDDDMVVACAKSKKVQWYQSEVSHLSVSKKKEGQGLGKEILLLAEQKAKKDGAKVIQCTIRTNNEGSIGLFTRKGYNIVNRFFYPNSGNWVYILQKTIYTDL